MKPILLLDVDGVVNCFGSIWTDAYEKENFDGGEGRMSDDGHGRLRVRHATKGLLAELAEVFEIVWCTAWEERAHPQFREWLGLPDELSHVPFTGWDGSLTEGRSWKAAHVAAWIAGHAPARAVAWLDDDFGEPDFDWAARRGAIAPTLLVRTSPSFGLLREHADRLLEFAWWARATALLAEQEHAVANCHNEIPCPRCLAPLGERCRRALKKYTSRGVWATGQPVLKHPHKERWTQVVPAR